MLWSVNAYSCPQVWRGSYKLTATGRGTQTVVSCRCINQHRRMLKYFGCEPTCVFNMWQLVYASAFYVQNSSCLPPDHTPWSHTGVFFIRLICLRNGLILATFVFIEQMIVSRLTKCSAWPFAAQVVRMIMTRLTRITCISALITFRRHSSLHEMLRNLEHRSTVNGELPSKLCFWKQRNATTMGYYISYIII